MDMKRILQALDGASKKPAEGSNDMKKFLQIVEGKGSSNRLTQAESIAVQTYTAPEPRKTITSPVLNVDKNARPSMVGKYFKQIEEEFKESQERYKDRATLLAERVAKKVMEQEITRRVTPNADGTVSGGLQPAPIDPDAPPKPARPPATQSRGHSREYIQKAADPNRVGRFLISVQQAQELLKQMDQQQDVQEETEGVDSVTLDIPLLIRLMEFAREDAQDDMTLHQIAERMIGMKEEGQSLSMSDYEDIVGGDKLDEACWKTHKQIGMKKKGKRIVPNCVPKENISENIDYSKPGPKTKSSLGHELEYGIPINAKGDFVNPNRLPDYEQLPDQEYLNMITAYKAWLKDYLRRWPSAKQQPDGTWKSIGPGLAPMYPKENINKK